MKVIYHKIWYDIWENRSRTLQVVLIITIGVFAVGSIIGALEFIQKDISQTWQATRPAVIGFTVEPAVNEATVEALKHLRGIEGATGWLQEGIKWRRSPAEPWSLATLTALDSYDEADQKIRKLTLDNGDWPERKAMAVQRGYDLEAGHQIYLQIDNKEYTIELGGVIYNAALPPPNGAPDPTFFTTRERFTQLTGEPNFNLILATIPEYNQAKVIAAADLLQAELEKQNIEVKPAMFAPGGSKARTTQPDRHPAQDPLDGIFFILTVMAVAALILGLFLVYNTITAIINQQVDQIGIMKAIGGRFRQILFIYFSMVLIYAFLALLTAIPLAALGAHGLRLFLIRFVNMQPGPFDISSRAIVAEVIVALLFPLLIAIIPVFSGARVTVREAISTYGLSASGVGIKLLDRLIARFQYIPRLLALILSNTFRHKSRVLLTQLSLVGSGLLFMMVMNTRASMTYTFSDVIFSIFEANVMLDLQEEERIQKIETLTWSYPGVKAVEVWGTAGATLRLTHQPESNDDPSVNLRGLPVPTQTYRSQMRAGRWLQPNDTYAAVLNQELAGKIGVAVGERITLDMPLQGQSNWQVVGLLYEPFDQDAVYLPRQTLLKELNQVGRGKTIRIQTHATDAAVEATVADGLRDLYEANGFEIQASNNDTAHRLTQNTTGRMMMVISLLFGMALIAAIVGGVALSGVLSLNVLDRRREIGVMRAIGASSSVIARLFIGEGLILGWLSWLLAVPLSVPAGQLMTQALSNSINTELVYHYSGLGILYWLILITLLSMLASWVPAQKAAQTSVRESLAYV